MELFEIITGVVFVTFAGFLFGLFIGIKSEKKTTDKRIGLYQGLLRNRARN